MKSRACLFVLCAALVAADAPPPTGGRARSVYDGDTLTLQSGEKIRLKWANAPEMKPREDFAVESRDAAYRFVDGADLVLEVDGERARDDYGRVLAGVRTPAGDLSLHLIELGLAHVYLIPPVDGDPAPYFAAQARARAARLGIWSTDRYQGALHVTSFHANAPGDEEKDPNLEYFRMCAIADAPVDLDGYTVEDARGQRFALPKMVVPPGHTVRVHSGRGLAETDPARQLVAYLGSDRPIWANDFDRVTLRAPGGVLVDSREHRVER
jgi:endonuclease YncB( thermonuclease family)